MHLIFDPTCLPVPKLSSLLCDVLVVSDCARAEPTKDTIVLESEKPQEDVRKQPAAEAVAEDRVKVSHGRVIAGPRLPPPDNQTKSREIYIRLC